MPPLIVIKFSPVIFLAPLAIPSFNSFFRQELWYRLVCWSLANCGAAWIKWAQWASTRPDMFPEALCDKLANLQTQAPVHSWSFTRKEIERVFCAPLEQVFSSFDDTPIASGSIAQVYRATYEGQTVAVKVRHPNVAEQIAVDFRLMRAFALWLDKQPLFKWLNLASSIEAFSHTMTGQTFLDIEGNHLDLFNENFRSWHDCTFPKPLARSEAVLVETFEKGQLVSDFSTRKKGAGSLPPSLAHFIVTRGEDLYLKMLINDRLMHADLHPGNILVQSRDLPFESQSQGVAELLSDPEYIRNRLVLVDAGMVAYLNQQEQRNFVGFLAAVGEGRWVWAAVSIWPYACVT